jgi:hypothetical protein
MTKGKEKERKGDRGKEHRYSIVIQRLFFNGKQRKRERKRAQRKRAQLGTIAIQPIEPIEA